MLTVVELRELSKKVVSDRIAQELEKLSSDMKGSAENGNTRIEHTYMRENHSFACQVVLALKAMGFNASVLNADSANTCISISWA